MKRRHFLRSAGTLGLALPFLPSLAGPLSAATPPIGGLKRVVFFVTGYGAVHYNWFPTDASRMERRISPRAVETSLSSFAGDLSPVFDRATWGAAASRGTLMDHLLMIDGIDGDYGCGHERHYALNGHAGSPENLAAPSIDQMIAASSALYPDGAPPFAALRISNGDNRGESISSRLDTSSGQVLAEPPLTEPGHVWDQIFQGIVSGGGPSAAELAQLQSEGMSVVDHVYEHFDSLRMSRRLSGADQRRLEAHMQFVRELEQSQTRPGATCERPMQPMGDYSDGYEYTRVRNFNDSRRGVDHVTNIVHAIRCGLTGVVTFDTMPAAKSYADLGCERGDFHGLTHAREGVANTVRLDADHQTIRESLIVERYDVGLLAQLMRGLDVVEDVESGRTFLDNTLIVMSSSMGSQVDHRGGRMPLLMAGGGGALNTGKLVDFRSEFTDTVEGRRDFRTGVHYDKFLVSICQCMGLDPTDYEYGQTGVGAHDLSVYLGGDFDGGMSAYEDYALGDPNEWLGELFADGID